jgi:hypothetical protein
MLDQLYHVSVYTQREAVDAEVEVKVADEDAKNVPHGLNIPVAFPNFGYAPCWIGT